MTVRLATFLLSGLLGISGCVSSDSQLASPEQSAVVEQPEQIESAPEPEEDPDPQVAEAFITPWPKGFTRSELSETALAKSFEFFDQREQGASSGLLTVVFQDTVLDIHSGWVTDTAELTVDSFANYMDEDLLLVLGTEHEFFVETLEARGRPFLSYAYPVGGKVCVAWDRNAWVSLPSEFTRERLPHQAQTLACVAHEIFHLAQDSLDKVLYYDQPPGCTEKARPHWLTEGTAQFIGLALVDYAGYADYWGLPGGELGDGLPSPILSSLEEYSGDAGYKWGALATEYIIASVGVEPLMEVWAIAGQCVPIDQAFEQAMGIPLADFYVAFDEMNAAMVMK